MKKKLSQYNFLFVINKLKLKKARYQLKEIRFKCI